MKKGPPRDTTEGGEVQHRRWQSGDFSAEIRAESGGISPTFH